MTLQQKIGQLIICGFQGATVAGSSQVIQDIRRHNLGGVIFFDRLLAKKQDSNNIISAAQTSQLIDDLQDAAHGDLLISVDQEGGRVNRFKEHRGFTITPAALDLAESNDPEATSVAAEQTAALLADLGFNFNLAPVVDLNTFPENPIIGRYKRSFAADPDLVVRHARNWIQTHHSYGIRCCLKHFPGHGSSREDSHQGFVDISTSWRRDELIPYKKLISEGLADAVMTGHLYNNELDSLYPATLSPNTVDGLLGEELGYSGVVLSDDLQMGAITSRYGLEEAACMAVSAGVDLLVVGNNMDYDADIVKKITGKLMHSVQSGLLSEERIDVAWQRVQHLKKMHPKSTV